MKEVKSLKPIMAKRANQEKTMQYQTVDTTYREMREPLLAIFRQVAIPMEDCEDLVQDVFLRLLAIDTLRQETVKGMTAVIALRMRTDYLRHRAFVRRASKELTVGSRPCCYGPDADCHARELRQIEWSIVENMPAKNRKVYELSRYAGKSVGEIAQATGMSNRAVESRVYRCRQEVRQRVRQLYG